MTASTPAAPTRARNKFVTDSWNRLARAYDFPILQRLAYRPPQDEILEQLHLTDARRIADIGCGTGILASRIYEEIGPDVLYGCDASEGMLAQAKARTPEVNWINRQAEDLGLPDGAVDAVVSTHAFHFFEHAPAVAEFHRILAPGGLLAIVVANQHNLLGQFFQLTTSPSVMYFPTIEEMRDLVEEAGFTLLTQRPIRRPLPGAFIPDVLTVARKH
ncbi:class I SAM-dependent methyltransferase [Nocardia callitridis]